MRHIKSLIGNAALCGFVIASIILARRYAYVAAPWFGDWSEMALMIPLGGVIVLLLWKDCRDPLKHGKRLLRKRRYDKAMLVFRQGMAKSHAGAAMALGDMYLAGYGCDSNYAAALEAYQNAVNCILMYEIFGESFYSRYPDPARDDSGDPIRNRRRLKAMAVNLESVGDPEDQATRELLNTIYLHLGVRKQ